MYKAGIAVQGYEKLAARLNPVKFNAAEWIRLAKQAGRKCMIMTVFVLEIEP